jgi:hypothetical protein
MPDQGQLTKQCWSERLKFGCRIEFPYNLRSRSALCTDCKRKYAELHALRLARGHETVFGLPQAVPRDFEHRATMAMLFPVVDQSTTTLLSGTYAGRGTLVYEVVMRDILDPERNDRDLALYLVHTPSSKQVHVTDLWPEEPEPGVVFLSGRTSDDKEVSRVEVRKVNDVYMLYQVNGPMRA